MRWGKGIFPRRLVFPVASSNYANRNDQTTELLSARSVRIAAACFAPATACRLFRFGPVFPISKSAKVQRHGEAKKRREDEGRS
jgi:hypothetical protein